LVPLRDENPISSNPRVTVGLIITNLVIFILQLSLSQPQLEAFWNIFAIVPIDLTASFKGVLRFPGLEWMTLVTSQFLHGGFLHIGGNMLYLWVFGNNIEDQLL
jgi:membrane associated rhomboid family serine protease